MPDIRVRWADNTGELTKHLKEGLNQIEATKAGAEKMVQALGGDKLMRAAHTWVAAVGQMGGAEKLTNAERERGISLLERAIEKYRVLGKEAPTALLATLNQTKALNQPLSQMVAGMTAAGQQATASGKMLAGMGVSGQAAMASIAKSTTSTVGPMTTMLGLARSLGPALGIGFGVGAVVSFGKSILADADALVKMSDKTGISTDALQMFRVAADDAGNTIDQLTTATNQMQNRLAGNDKSAVAAIEKLGLNLRELKRLAPDQQFMAIADAIREIQDPAEQVNVAMDIFGRQGAEILPTIKRGFDDVKDGAQGMSAEAVKGLDALGDAFTRAARSAKASAGEFVAALLPAARILNTLRQGRADLLLFGPEKPPLPEGATQMTPLEQATLHRPQFTAPFPVVPPGIPEDLDEITRALDRERSALTASAGPANKAAEAHQRFLESVHTATDAFTGGTLALNSYLTAIPGANAGTGQLAESMLTLNSVVGLTARDTERLQREGRFLSAALIQTNGEIVGLAEGAESAAESLRDADEATFSWSKSLKGLFSGNFRASLKAIGAELKSLLDPSKILNTAIGGLLSGGISSLIGLATSGIGKLFRALGNIGGPSKEELAGRAESFDFQDQIAKTLNAQQRAEAGGEAWKMTMIGVRDAYIATGRSAADAERIVRELWNTKDPEAYKRAMQEIQGVMDEQKRDQQDLQTAIEKYKFTIDELGPVMQKQQLDEQAKTLLNDWRLLVGASIDVTVVNGKMADSINAYLQTAKRTGTEIPSAMKPILQTLIEQGKLVDENGNKITDLTESGLTFSETMTQGFDRVVNALNRVLVGLGLIPEALAEIPDHKTIRVDVDYRDSGIPGSPDGADDGFDRGAGGGNFAARGGLVTPHGIQHFAEGGMVMARGTDTVPAMLTPGEKVLTEGQQSVLGRHDAAILASLDAIREAILSRSVTSVQINRREIARANVEAWDNGQFLTEARELFGVT